MTAYIGCSFTNNYVLFIAIYGTFIGLGFGLLYMTALKNAWQYCPSKKGLISGLILSCYSLGSIVWTNLTKHVANPNNEKPKEYPVDGGKSEYYFDENSDVVKNVPQMFRILAYCNAGMILVSVILI